MRRVAGPVVALAMGERGLPSRLLASKFGGHLTFGCLSEAQGSAPGQPAVCQLLHMYRIPLQKPSTQVGRETTLPSEGPLARQVSTLRLLSVVTHQGRGRHACSVWQSSLWVQVFGVIGNPVSHSRSPALHNAALQAAGLDAVYIPLLVDTLPSFLGSFNTPDFKGFSVTIPHKVHHSSPS